MWFNRAALKAEAKACMRQSKANPYITALVYILISYILALLANRLVIPDNLIYFAEDQYGRLMAYFSFDGLEYIVSRPPLAYVIYFLIDISSMMLGAGMVIFVLNVARRAASSVGNLFDGFVQFPRIFLLYLAEGLFIFLWSLLFVIPGIIAAYRYRLAIYLLLEHPEMGVMACIRSFVVINLRRNGYEPVEAATGEEALNALSSDPDISVALLDVMLPDIDGFEVCRRIRASGSKMGIIMLTALGQEMDKVTGLMNGADDYVTKPFSPAELIARVDALCRRMGASEEPEEPELVSGPFLLNPRNRTLDKNGERVKLTQTEFSIMKLFMSNPGKALSREDILENVWGADYKGELKIVDVNIRRLRIKIEDNPTAPEYITTIWGYGYKWGS